MNIGLIRPTRRQPTPWLSDPTQLTNQVLRRMIHLRRHRLKRIHINQISLHQPQRTRRRSLSYPCTLPRRAPHDRMSNHRTRRNPACRRQRQRIGFHSPRPLPLGTALHLPRLGGHLGTLRHLLRRPPYRDLEGLHLPQALLPVALAGDVRFRLGREAAPVAAACHEVEFAPREWLGGGPGWMLHG
jgi:hypothetical protein